MSKQELIRRTREFARRAFLTFVANVELLPIEDKELNLLTKESNERTAILVASLKP